MADAQHQDIGAEDGENHPVVAAPLVFEALSWQHGTFLGARLTKGLTDELDALEKRLKA